MDVLKSASNDKIKKLRALLKSPKERKASGLFAAEGVKIYNEAPEELIQEVYLSESFAAENPGIAGTVVEDSLFERVCDTRTPQGILTVFRQPAVKTEDLIHENAFITVLENVQDPGNVGTIIRTAEGAGVDGVILSSGCADLYSPKTIRSTMGSIFRVPHIVSDDIVKTVRELKKAGMRVYAAHLRAEKYYDEYDYTEGCAILIGNEGNGLTEELSKEADELLKIPMEGKLESLNAAVAASILMYTVHSKRKGSISDE